MERLIDMIISRISPAWAMVLATILVAGLTFRNVIEAKARDRESWSKIQTNNAQPWTTPQTDNNHHRLPHSLRIQLVVAIFNCLASWVGLWMLVSLARLPAAPVDMRSLSSLVMAAMLIALGLFPRRPSA